MASDADVVVALATPWGRSALAVVRFSGPGCHDVVARLCRVRRGGPLSPGGPRRVDVVDADGVVDDGVVILGAGPRTSTGEDVAELTVHGNPVLVARVLAAAEAAGARPARPGEFTRRAVVNGRLDLVGAEAVHATISATSARGAALARAGLDGRLGARLDALRTDLVVQTAELEARLDGWGDELAVVPDEVVIAALHAVAEAADALAATARVGRTYVDGATVALVGAVNAGKSSLFNALVGQTRALVHDAPGTTRDVVEATLDLDGVRVRLLDTAGERATDDPIEAAGLALGAGMVEAADLVVIVARASDDGVDPVADALAARLGDRPVLWVGNRADEARRVPDGALPTVAPEGRGVDALRAALVAALVGEAGTSSDVVLTSARQAACLRALAAAARDAADALPLAGPAVAADLATEALASLDALTGADTREDVLDAVFARFCIGK